MMRTLLVLLALAGCDRVFQVDSIEPPPDAALETGMIAYYPMEALGADNRLRDEAGDHDGVCSTPTCPTVVEGVHGNALQFDGAMSMIDVAGTSDLQTPAGFTVATWLRIDAKPPGTQCAVGKVQGTSDNTWQFCVWDTLAMNVHYSGTGSILPGRTITAGEWHHVAARWDTTTMTLFIDGLPVGSTDAVLEFDSGPLVIGGDRNTGLANSLFDGAIDDVRVYGRVLSEQEILDLFAAAG